MYTREQLSKYAYFDKLLESYGLPVILDPLTGVVSRKYILEFAQSLIDAGVPFTFGMLDLDNFKFINDTYGHNAGDRVLMHVSGALSKCLDGFGVVGRFGGDEFLWVNFRDLSYDEKKAFLGDMYTRQEVLRKSIPLENCAPFITGTVGCATYPDNARDFDALFGMIDKTLYRGKNKGRNCYIIYVKEKHESIEIRRIARHGMYTLMNNVVRLFEMVPGLKNRLQSVTPVLIDELRVSDLYYVGPHRVMRSVRDPEVREAVDDIDRISDDEVYATNDPDEIAARCPVFHAALKRMEVETLMVVRVGMDNQRADGYLVFAEPRSRRIWQEDECAIMFFLAKLIAGRIRIEGEPISDA